MRHQAESISRLPADFQGGNNSPINRFVFDALPNSAYVREAQLVQSPTRPDSTAPLPFSAPTLWRKVKAGTFPKPIKLSERVTCWQVGTVRAWMLAQEALAYNPGAIVQKQAQVKRTELAKA